MKHIEVLDLLLPINMLIGHTAVIIAIYFAVKKWVLSLRSCREKEIDYKHPELARIDRDPLLQYFYKTSEHYLYKPYLVEIKKSKSNTDSTDTEPVYKLKRDPNEGLSKFSFYIILFVFLLMGVPLLFPMLCALRIWMMPLINSQEIDSKLIQQKLLQAKVIFIIEWIIIVAWITCCTFIESLKYYIFLL